MDEPSRRFPYRLRDAFRCSSGFLCRHQISRGGLSLAASFVLLLLTAALPRTAVAASDHQPYECNEGSCQTLGTINVTARYIPPPPAPPPPAPSLNNFSAGQGAPTGNERGGGGRDFSSNNHTASTKKSENKGHCQATAADPVVVSSGAKVLAVPLFQMPGEMGLRYGLYYHSVTSSSFWAMNPWTSSVSFVLDLYCGITDPDSSCSQVTLYRPDGSSLSFSGNHAAYGNFPEIGGGGLATLVHNSDGTWTLHDEDTNILTFDSNGDLASIRDVAGIGWTISTTMVSNGVSTDGSPCDEAVEIGTLRTCPTPPPPPVPTTTTTTVVTHTDGQSFTIVEIVWNAGTSDMSGSVTVTDPAGNQYSYVLGFNEVGEVWTANVASVTFPGSPATTMTFNYTGSNALLSGVAYNGTAYWSTGYNSNNEVSSDGAADGTERTSILYATSSGGMVATITNPLGLTTKNTYTTDSQGNYCWHRSATAPCKVAGRRPIRCLGMATTI